MNEKQILKEFRCQFGHLSKYGLKIQGIGNMSGDHNVISVSTPFIFDHRALPKNFRGIEVRSSTLSNIALEEFQNIGKDKEYIWAYQRFEKFVDGNANLIHNTLNHPDLTREEMLDALCFGDFKKHREMCIKWENEGKIPKWQNNEIK